MDLEKLDQLPKRESRKEFITRKYGNMYNLSKFDHPWYVSDKADNVYFIKQIILKKYLGKSFDDAFSEFCKKVPKYKQSDFLDEFTIRKWRDNADYLIDKKGNIQLNPDGFATSWLKYKKRNSEKPVTFNSFDYKEGYQHKFTKEIKENLQWFDRVSDYNRVVLSGFSKTFSSKKDPEYKRLMFEKRKQINLNKKLVKAYKKQKQYSFLSNKELEKKENMLTDLEKFQKINSCETINELENAILSFAVNGEIQGRTRSFNAERMAGNVKGVVENLLPANTLTREFGIRQQALYLSYYK